MNCPSAFIFTPLVTLSWSCQQDLLFSNLKTVLLDVVTELIKLLVAAL